VSIIDLVTGFGKINGGHGIMDLPVQVGFVGDVIGLTKSGMTDLITGKTEVISPTGRLWRTSSPLTDQRC
jgi:hypothetical protein